MQALQHGLRLGHGTQQRCQSLIRLRRGILSQDWLEAGSAGEYADGGNGYDHNAHRWAISGTDSSDVNQTAVPSCSFLSGLAGGAMQGIDLASRISYLGNYQYQVSLYHADSGCLVPILTSFNGSFATNLDGGMVDTMPAVEGEFWVILYQRAYLSMMNQIDEDIHDPDYALFAVTGRPVITADWQNPATVDGALNAGLVLTAWDADQTSLIHDGHAYTVMDVFIADGEWKIKLRNPWGCDGGDTTYGDPNDGIIVMSWCDFQGIHDFDAISIS